MPWAPELFSAPAIERLAARRRHERLVMPYFDGILTGELDALINSFSGEPRLRHPIQGEIRGVRAFEDFVEDMNRWFAAHDASVGEPEIVITEPRGFEEVVIAFDTDEGRVQLPHALIADHDPEARLEELRIYFSSWPYTGRHTNRAPLLSSEPRLALPDVVDRYQRALAAADLDGIVEAFEPDGYAREPAGAEYVHRGTRELRDFYERQFSNGGGIPQERCSIVDGGRVCALEYNLVRWGEAELEPSAAVAAYVRGESGRLAAVRVYDDVDPPVGTASAA
jgi:hypothetical protein